MSSPYNDLISRCVAFGSSVIFRPIRNTETLIIQSQFAGRSYKKGQVVGSYPASLSLPLCII